MSSSINPYEGVSAGVPTTEGVGAGGGLGNRVNAIVLSTVLKSQEAAMKQLLTSLGIGSQVNVTI